MNTVRTNVRLGIEGDAETKRRLRETGQVGDRALKQIADASRPASAGLRTVNAASNEGQAAMRGYAAQAGPVGGILTALGPAGLTAAAGIGAMVAGMRGASTAVAEFDTLAKTADKIGVATDYLQEMRFAAGSLAGMNEGALDTSLQRFNRRMAEAAQGTGEAKAALEELGVPLRDNEGRLRSTEAVMADVARGMTGMESDADRLRIAVKLFDTEGAAMVNVLKDSGRAMDETRARARDLGIVIGEDVLRSAEDMKDELDTASKIIDVNLKTALIDLAPFLVDAMEGFARFAQYINAVRDAVASLENMSLKGIRGEIGEIDAAISRLEKARNDKAGAPVSGSVAGPFAAETPGNEGAALARDIAALQADRAVLEAELARRDALKSEFSKPLVEPVKIPSTKTGTTKTKTVRDTLAELNAASLAAADIQADTETRERAILLIQQGRVTEAESLLRLTTDIAAVERAERDARAKGIADGLKGTALDNAVEAARIEASATANARDSQQALAEAKSVATKKASDAAAKTAKDDAERVAAAKRLINAEGALTTARAEGSLVVRAATDAALATDRASLDLVERRLQAERDAAQIKAAGNQAVSSAGAFDDVDALRATAEAREREIIATRQFGEAMVENRRILDGRLAATRSLADAQAAMDAARTAAAPVLAGVSEAALAASADELDALRERIAAEQDLIRIRAAGSTAAAGAGEFDDPARLREIAEQRERDTIALRDGNAALAERQRILEGQDAAREALTASNDNLSEARSAASPMIDAGARVAAATSIDELNMILDEVRDAQDALAIVAAGNRAAAGAGEFGDAEALRANAEAMERLNQASRDAREFQQEKIAHLREEAKIRDDLAERTRKNNEAIAGQVEGIARGVLQQAQNWDSVGDAVLGVAQILEQQGVFKSLFDGLSGAAGAVGGAAGGAAPGGAAGGGFGDLLSGFSSAVGSFFGGGRMLGGSTSAGTLYEVNEAGRGEMFRSNVSGNIYSLGDSAAAKQSMPTIELLINEPGPNTTATARMRDSKRTTGRDASQALGQLSAFG